MRAAWTMVVAMLVVGQARAQEIYLRVPKGVVGCPEVRLDGEEIGRRALLRVERQLARETFDERYPKYAGPSGADILSDTQGVDFNPYLREMLRAIYGRWVLLLPAEARPPQNVAGTTLIRFKIDPEGKILAMSLEGSSHKDSLNQAAWEAIAGVGPLRWLPAEFTGPFLELRIHFLVNERAAAGR